MAVKTYIALPTRTATQTGAAAVIVAFIDAFLHDLTPEESIAATALLTLIFSIVQSLLEHFFGWTFLLEGEEEEDE